MTYQSLMQAVRIIAKSRLEVCIENDYEPSPAFSMLLHAGTYLHKQADKELRGEEAI